MKQFLRNSKIAVKITIVYKPKTDAAVLLDGILLSARIGAWFVIFVDNSLHLCHATGVWW